MTLVYVFGNGDCDQLGKSSQAALPIYSNFLLLQASGMTALLMLPFPRKFHCLSSETFLLVPSLR